MARLCDNKALHLQGNPLAQVSVHSGMHVDVLLNMTPSEMTNQYMTAFAEDPIIRGAVMQSADSKPLPSHPGHYVSLSWPQAAQPMWPLNDQISKIASNMSCPTGRGLLNCLRTKSATDLQKVLLATGTQFQPVTDNVTIWKEYVQGLVFVVLGLTVYAVT